mmetsp:Transcript_5656/g.14336  ORF Transcript_5656/g.14336 Transcript_5656/m.14336 type:complete len:269 (+) Transcript_5656:552-1358(+)
MPALRLRRRASRMSWRGRRTRPAPWLAARSSSRRSCSSSRPHSQSRMWWPRRSGTSAGRWRPRPGTWRPRPCAAPRGPVTSRRRRLCARGRSRPGDGGQEQGHVRAPYEQVRQDVWPAAGQGGAGVQEGERPLRGGQVPRRGGAQDSPCGVQASQRWHLTRSGDRRGQGHPRLNPKCGQGRAGVGADCEPPAAQPHEGGQEARARVARRQRLQPVSRCRDDGVLPAAEQPHARPVLHLPHQRAQALAPLEGPPARPQQVHSLVNVLGP